MDNAWVQGSAFALFGLLTAAIMTIGFSDSSPSEFFTARVCLSLCALEVLAFSGYALTVSTWPLAARLLIAAFVGVLVVPGTVGSFVWLSARQQRLAELNKPPAQPDITMRLVYPSSPALILENKSDVTAAGVLWAFTVWNLSEPRAFHGQTEDVHEPLQIPTQTIAFIRSHSLVGPLNLFQGVQQYVKPGDWLFGSMSVTCAACKRGRTYWVNIIFGKEGWYSELPNMTNGQINIPPVTTRKGVLDWAQSSAAAIGADSRNLIGGLQ